MDMTQEQIDTVNRMVAACKERSEEFRNDYHNYERMGRKEYFPQELRLAWNILTQVIDAATIALENQTLTSIHDLYSDLVDELILLPIKANHRNLYRRAILYLNESHLNHPTETLPILSSTATPRCHVPWCLIDIHNTCARCGEPICRSHTLYVGVSMSVCFDDGCYEMDHDNFGSQD